MEQLLQTIPIEHALALEALPNLQEFLGCMSFGHQVVTFLPFLTTDQGFGTLLGLF
jgi:hypothetical protein